MEKNGLRTDLEKIWATSFTEDYIAYEVPELCAAVLRAAPDADAIGRVINTGNLVAYNMSAFEPSETANFLTYILSASPTAPDTIPWEAWAIRLLTASTTALNEGETSFFYHLFTDPWSQQAILQSGVTNPGFGVRTQDMHYALESWLTKKWGFEVSVYDRNGQGSAPIGWMSILFDQAKGISNPAALAAICLLTMGPLRHDDSSKMCQDGQIYDYDPVPRKRIWRYEIFDTAIAALAAALQVSNFGGTTLNNTKDFQSALMTLWDRQEKINLPFETLSAFYFMAQALVLCPHPFRERIAGQFPGIKLFNSSKPLYVLEEKQEIINADKITKSIKKSIAKNKAALKDLAGR